jgi:hypothetical protein
MRPSLAGNSPLNWRLLDWQLSQEIGQARQVWQTTRHVHVSVKVVDAEISPVASVAPDRVGDPYNAGIFSRCFAGIGDARRFSTIAYRNRLARFIRATTFCGLSLLEVFMRFGRLSVGLFVGSLAAIGCSSDSTGPRGPSITLTATNAAVLMARITELAPVHPELAWLADSARLVLKSGAEADLIPITTDLAAGPFYAVGLERGVQASATSFSTFDLIAFNDPSNPTDFIIVDGFTTGAVTPPTSASGDFGGGVNGHLFHVEGNTVTAWRAQGGTATLSTGGMGDACAGFVSNASVSCAQSTLTAAFTITSSVEDSGVQGSGTRTASLTPTTVAGIILSFNFP